MYRATRGLAGSVAVALVVLAFSVTGMGIAGASPFAAVHPGAVQGPATAVAAPSHSSNALAGSGPAGPVAPAAGTTNVTVTYMTTFDVNTSIPASYQFDVNVTTGTISNTNTSIWVQVYDYTASAWVTNLSLNNTVNSVGLNGTGGTVSSGVVAGVEYNDANWTGGLNMTTFGCTQTICNDVLTLHDTFNVTVQVIEDGTGMGGTVAQNNTTAATNFVGALTSYSVTFQPSGPNIAQYSKVPFEVNYSLAVENATIDPTNVSMQASITNAVSGYVQSTFAIPTVTGVTDYSFWVDDANLSCPAIDPTCSQISGAYFLSVFISVSGYAGPTYGTIASGPHVVNTTEARHHNYLSFITVPLSISLLSPAASVVSEGNVTLSMTYTGQYVLVASETIYSPSNHSLAIFSANLLKDVNGTPTSVLWSILNPGAYPVSAVIQTLYGASVYVNYTLTVQVPGGGTVYVNTTSWHNSTSSGILGMSGAAGGTILLVVGLIIGLIVAMVLGRAVYARPAAAPAQPWAEAKPSAPNTCSLCGKSFATPDELQAHSKSEHGV